ncbi:MAG: PCYCGC motif-containing (lipo)protein [Chloroflexota bacterium]
MMKRLLILMVLGMLTAVLAACGSDPQVVSLDDLEMASLSHMPQMVHEAPVRVQEAYQFAQMNKDVLEHIPCYCGCGAMGHTSNYSCFIAETEADGTIVYDEHALGCGICVDIAHDTMRLLAQGKDVDTIFTEIDNNYARFGPPTPIK